MAITVIGGLLFSTMLTLIFIPVVYDLLDRKTYAAESVLPAHRDDELSSIDGIPGSAPGRVPGD